MSERLISFIGAFIFLAIAYLISKSRRKVSWRLVIIGTALTWLFAFLAIGIPALNIPGPMQFIFSAANSAVVHLLKFTEEGSRFVFGDLVNTSKIGFIFAFQVLPTIIFMASLMAVLYQIGFMQPVVHFLAVIMQKLMGTSGAEALSNAANIFVGQTEAPLVIKPFVSKMTQSELLAVMVGGMATVAGGVLAAYTGMLRSFIPDIAGHLLTASFMSAPAAFVMAKLLLPETETPQTLGGVPPEAKKKAYSNVLEAAAGGASEGVYLAINVAAMLLAFIALIALVNGVLGWLGQLLGLSISFEILLGWFFAPFAWLMGIPWTECIEAGALLGQKTILNEFVAYFNFASSGQSMSPRTAIILSYALCGFANFSSIAIQIGGIGGIAPERKADLAKLGILAVIGGTLATFLTAAIAGVLI